MQKTFQKILDSKPWVRRIVDERKHGGSITVTLYSGYVWKNNFNCVAQTFDTIKEAKQKTNFDYIENVGSAN
jgi:hypothetical protein